MSRTRNRSIGRRVFAITALLLIVGAGFCLFVGDGHDEDQVHQDRCGSIVVTAMAAVLLTAPLALGWAAARPMPFPLGVALFVLDPPPKPVPSAR